MAINFEEEKKKRKASNKKQAEKWNKANPNQKVASNGSLKKRADKEKALSNLNKISARYGGVSKGYQTESSILANQKAKATEAYKKYHSGYKSLDNIDKVAAGLTTGFVKTLVPVSLFGSDGETVTEKAYPELKQNKVYKWSNTAGTIGAYALPYGAASKVTGKVATKVVGTKAGQKLISKAAKSKLFKTAARKSLTKAGQNATTKAIEHAAKKQAGNVAKSFVKGAVADATIGTVLNNNAAMAEGLKPGTKEWAKYMAESAAMDFAAGGAMEIAPTALKGLSKGSGKKTVQRIVDGKVKNVKVDKTYMDFAQESQKNALSKSKKAVDTAQNEYNVARSKLFKVEQSLQSKAAKKTENVAKLNEMRQKKLSAAEKEFKQAELKLEKKQHAYDNAIKASLPEPRVNQKVKASMPKSYNEAKKAALPTEKTSYVRAEHVAPEHKATFNQYVNSTDRDLKQFVENSRNGVRKKKDFKDFSSVGQREAADVKAATGVDVSGYKHRLKTSTIQEHIDPRHGANGKADMSMADSNDIARIGYVLDNYDSVELLKNTDGSTKLSSEFRNSDGSFSVEVKFKKRVDGHYYVVTAVPDNKNKTLNVVTAYIEKNVDKTKKTGQVVDAKMPLPRHAQDALDMESVSMNSIPDSAGKINGSHEKIGGFEVEGGKNAFASPDLKFADDIVENAEGIFDKFYKNAVSGQHELEKMAKKANSSSVTDNVQAVRNAKSTADNIITQRLVDANGRTIDNRSFIDVVNQIPKKELKRYNKFAQHLHNIDRWKADKPLFKDVSPEESRKIVEDILREHPEYAEISKDITEWWNKFTHAWLVDTGRMSKEAWLAMSEMYPHYVPGFRVSKGMGGIGGAKGNRAQVGDAIKSAVGGYSEVISMEDAFTAQIDRFVKNVRRNDLYLDIVDTLTNNKELQQFGLPVKERVDDAVGSIDAFMTKLEEEHVKQIGDKAYMVTGFRDGKKVSAYVNADVMRALELLDNAYGSKELRSFAEFGQKFTNPMKAGITGINPLFAIANAARDIPTYFIQSNSNPFTAFSNLGKALKEMVTGGELYHQYIGMGGKNAGYFAQGKGFRDAAGLDKSIAAKTWDKTKEILSFIGEGTETLPRLAEYLNGLKKYGNTPEGIKHAMADSAEVTVNFSRSAPITKTADAYVLYLNAAVQGLDKFARTVKAHPLRTVARSAGAITAPYALLMAYNWDNPNYQDLTERTKQNYFCIPNMMGEHDENGYATTFIKIPVNREYGAILGSSLDVIAGYITGEENPWKGFGETMSTNFMPPSITADNITAPFKQNLPNNKDFAGRAIVPAYLEKASPINQQDASTSGIAKWIAGAANNLGNNTFLGGLVPDTLKSPMKVDYLIDSYGGYLGDVAQSASSGEAKNAKEFLVDTIGKKTILEPFKQRFTADPVYSSGVIQDFYEEKDKLETAKTDAKLNGEEYSAANAKYKVYNEIQKALSDFTKEERAILNDKTLTKEERERKVREIRRKRIALARSAKEKAKAAEQEYNEAPNFSALDKKAKEKWQGSGVDKETYAKLYNSRTVKTGAGKTIANRINMVNAGGSYKEAKAVDSKLKKDAWQRAKNLANLGISASDVQKISKGADYNKNGGISAEELTSYLNRTNYSRYEKAYIFNALCPNVKYNPYA